LVQLGRVIRAEAAEEDELLWRRDGRDRVHLEEAEPSHGVEHRGRGAVEQLRADGNAPCLLDRQVFHEPITRWPLPGSSTSPLPAPVSVTSIGAEPEGTPTGNHSRPTRTTISRPSSSPSGAKLSSQSSYGLSPSSR